MADHHPALIGLTFPWLPTCPPIGGIRYRVQGTGYRVQGIGLGCWYQPIQSKSNHVDGRSHSDSAGRERKKTINITNSFINVELIVTGVN